MSLDAWNWKGRDDFGFLANIKPRLEYILKYMWILLVGQMKL